jgi:hypothetical protein
VSAAITARGASVALSQQRMQLTPRRQFDAQVGWTLGRGVSMSAGAIEGNDWRAQRVQRQTLTIGMPLARRGASVRDVGPCASEWARGIRDVDRVDRAGR